MRTDLLCTGLWAHCGPMHFPCVVPIRSRGMRIILLLGTRMVTSRVVRVPYRDSCVRAPVCDASIPGSVTSSVLSLSGGLLRRLYKDVCGGV